MTINSRKPSRLFRAWRMGARQFGFHGTFLRPHPPFALGVGRAESYLRDLPQAFQPSRFCPAIRVRGDITGLASNPLETPSEPVLGA